MKIISKIKSLASSSSMRTLAPGIEVFENNFPRWQEVIDQAERSPAWVQAGIRGVEVDTKLRDASLHLLDAQSELHKLLTEHYINAMVEYKKKYAGVVVNTLEPLQIARYEAGGHYAVHTDAMGKSGGDRIVSSVLYLNDSYEGGELYFPLFDIKYKPEAGSLVLFPSYYTYEHGAMPIKKGSKYCVLAWYKT